jgi:pimeloyl-ACP methyl ester carboxylesterase
MKKVIFNWKQSIGLEVSKPTEFQDFILAGHSYGGYIFSNYSLKYHSKIKKLILLSPIGMKEDKIDPDDTESKDFNSMEDHPKWFRYIGEMTWKYRITPMQLGRFIGLK